MMQNAIDQFLDMYRYEEREDGEHSGGAAG
jgi:hypothetical protein